MPSQGRVHLPVRVVERIGVGRIDRGAVDVVDRRGGVVLAGLERIAERSAGRYHTAREKEFVDTLALRGDPVRVERSVDIDAEILENGRAQRNGDVRKSHGVGQEVIGYLSDAEFVDQFDLLHTRGIAFAEHLHFERLRERGVDGHGLTGAGHAEDAPFERRVGLEITQRIALHGLYVAVFLLGEVGGVGEAHRRGDRVADRLYLARFLLGLVAAIDDRRGLQAEVVVVQTVEPVLRVEFVDAVQHRVPNLLLFFEIPLFGVVDRRSEVDIVEDVVRRRDGNAMLEAVLHVLECFLGEDFGLFGVGLVVELAGVAERNLFVPPLLAHRLLAFEGVEGRNVEDDVRQGDRERSALRVLRNGHVGRKGERGAEPAFRIGDRRTCLRLERFVQAGSRIAVVAAGTEIDRCGEGRSRIGFGVLRMLPVELEVVLLEEVGFALVADTDVRVVEIQGAVVLVTLHIARHRGCLPRSEGVDTAPDGQVHVLSEREVVAQVTDVESLGRFLAESRHQQTRLGAGTEREETLGQQRKADGNVFQDQVGGTRDHFLAGNHLRLGHRQVEVGVVRLVAGGVFAVLDVDGVVVHLFDVVADQPAVALLSRHAFDFRLFAADVVGDRVHRVGIGGSFGESGVGNCRFAVYRVALAVGVDDLFVHIDPHEISLEIHVLVVDIALVVDIDRAVAYVVVERVLVFAADDVVQERFFPGRIALGRVLTQRIAQQRVVAGGSRTVGGGDRREGRRSEDRVDPGVEKRILLLFRTCFGGRGAVGFPLKAPNLPAGFAAGFLYGLCRSAVGRCLAFGCRGMLHSARQRHAEHRKQEEQQECSREDIFCL